jgi:hemerythrin-like domain-containing protein
MEATDVLIEEHRVIRRALSALDKQTGRLASGAALRAGFFQDATAFFRNFADSCHQRKEEGPFQSAMMDAGLSDQTGPLAIMLAEHELARTYLRAIEKAVLRLERGEGTAREDVGRETRTYSSFLLQHMRREDEFLFPMAERLVAPAAKEKLAVELRRYEHEEAGSAVCRKYRDLVESLEDETSA